MGHPEWDPNDGNESQGAQDQVRQRQPESRKHNPQYVCDPRSDHSPAPNESRIDEFATEWKRREARDLEGRHAERNANDSGAKDKTEN